MSAIATNNAYASEAGASQAGVDQPAVHAELGAESIPASQKAKLESIQARYTQERSKRLRPEGRSQFFNLANSEKYKHLAGDCWVNRDNTPRLTLQNGMHTKVFIVGGGFGGLLYAVRLVQAGIKIEDIIIADAAGGYGGTWYWNRYPGLMCDVESYLYLPLLEETGYMPKHKYSYGGEIREYANKIATHWNLEGRGAFQQQVTQLDWLEAEKCWQVKTTDLKTGSPISLTAEFVCVAPGLLHQPKLADFHGIEKFKGHFFHTARWDYDFTGGSPDDPVMTNLKDKKVGIIGTGATAIQAVPHLARCAKELYIFQRTPSSVDRRDQRPTDPEEWATDIAKQKGWQRERAKNFNCFQNNAEPLPARDLVNDGWSNFPSYSALLGGPKKVSQENVADHIAKMHALDAPRQEYIRDRASRIVQDPDTANKLKPWYAGWCKRPCFHDEYLQTFNRPNVHLVDTDGKGVDNLGENGIIANGKEYDLDCIVFGTGYSLEAFLSPTKRGGIDAYGRNGKSLDEKWAENVATLHGVLTHDFPNLFFSGPSQATASANFSSVLDILAQHSAYVISHALKQSDRERVVIEPSPEAEEEWSMRIMSGAMVFAAVAGCTPSYLNGEGATDKMTMEQKMKSARSGMWSMGVNDFTEVLDSWQKDGNLEGLEITAV